MSFTVAIRDNSNVTIVDLGGRITLGEGSGTVRSTVKRLADSGKKNIILNLLEVSYMDSAGLGELIGGYASVTNQGGTLKLLNVQRRVRDLLVVTKIYPIFEIFDEESMAVKSFSAAAGA